MKNYISHKFAELSVSTSKYILPNSKCGHFCPHTPDKNVRRYCIRQDLFVSPRELCHRGPVSTAYRHQVCEDTDLGGEALEIGQTAI